MKEVEKNDTPDVSGGEVDAYGNPLPVAYPIYPVPVERPGHPLIIPEAPLP
jgi:hypothetical protein